MGARQAVDVVGVVVALALVTLLSACRDPAASTTTSSAPGPVTTTTAPSDIPAAIRSYRASRDWHTVAPPVTVRIPAIGVDSPLESLGLDAHGAIEVPSWPVAGWYEGGVKPGQDGPAVILGHVDSPVGAAVFARLDELRPGDEVLVDRADATTVRFVVERLERHPKDRFPTEAVYGSGLQPRLRLVTCGGSFDRSVGHYRDNLIVFAAPA